MNHIVSVDFDGLIGDNRHHHHALSSEEDDSLTSSLEVEEDGVVVVLKDSSRIGNESSSCSLSCSCDQEGRKISNCSLISSSSNSSSGFLEESFDNCNTNPSEGGRGGDCETQSFLKVSEKAMPIIMKSKQQQKVEVSVISLEKDGDFLGKGLPSNNNNVNEGNKDILTKEKKLRKGFCGRYLGIMLALGSSVIFPLGGLAVKALGEYHTYSISVWRFQGVLLPAIPIALYHRCVKGDMIFDTVLPLRDPGKIKTLLFLVLRGFAGATAVVLQFYSLKYISMADSMVISFSTPVFVTLVAHLFLGEKCGILPIVSGVVVLLGVGVITRPPLLTGNEAFDSDNLIGACLALGCMVFATTTFVLLRYLRKLHYSMITLFFGMWGTGETLVLALIVGRLELPHSLEDWGIAVGLAVATFFGQTCMTLAFKFEQAGTISLCRTTDVIFAFLWQFLFLGVIPDRYSVIGAAIVVFGILLIAVRKRVAELPEGDPTRKRLAWLLK